MAQRDKVLIEVYQGDDEPINISIVDRTTGEAIDFSGATVTFNVKQHEHDREILFSQSVTDGTNSKNFADGQAAVVLDAENTELLKHAGWYNFKIVFLDGTILTAGYGPLGVQVD